MDTKYPIHRYPPPPQNYLSAVDRWLWFHLDALTDTPKLTVISAKNIYKKSFLLKFL